jgi:RNA polymerase primary sigma factor
MIVPLLQRERSIDDFIDKEEGFRLAAVLADQGSPSPEDRLYQKEVQVLVQAAYQRLDDRERYIIRNRFGLLGGKEQTLEEIGQQLNLSRERVRQLEREAKAKLRGTLRRFESSVRFSLS